MIIIKKRGIFYWLYDFGCNDWFFGDDINLCHYAQRVILGILKAMSIAFIIAGYAFIVCMAVYVLFKLERFLFTTFTNQTLLGHLGILLLIAIGIAQHYRYKRLSNVEPQPRQPNLFVEWIKAKKQKVCPLVKLED